MPENDILTIIPKTGIRGGSCNPSYWHGRSDLEDGLGSVGFGSDIL
jgi:hypothetical protein